MGFGPIPVQEELLNNGVRAKPRSRRITEQLGFGPIPVQEESLNSGVGAHPPARITQQWGSGQFPFKKSHQTTGFGQSPFKKNHSTVGFRPNPHSRRTSKQWVSAIPIQEKSSANRRSRRITEQWGSGQSPFKKNHSTVGFGPIPATMGFAPLRLQEEWRNKTIV